MAPFFLQSCHLFFCPLVLNNQTEYCCPNPLAELDPAAFRRGLCRKLWDPRGKVVALLKVEILGTKKVEQDQLPNCCHTAKALMSLSLNALLRTNALNPSITCPRVHNLMNSGAASNRSNVAAYNTRNIAHGPDCRCPGRPGQAHGDTRDESDEPDAFFDMPRVCEFYDSDGRRHERVAVPSYLPPGALPPFPPFDNAPNSGDANNAPPRQQAARGCHHPPRRHYRGRGWRGGRGSYRGSCQNSPGINQQQNPQPRGGYQGRGGQRQQPQNQGVQELQQALNELSLQDGEAQQANGQQGGDAGDQPGDMPSLE
jgi:hypothetical protein